MYVYFCSLYISGNQVLIIRRINVSMRHLVYVTMCKWPSRMQEHMLLHTRRSSTHSDINQVSNWYNNSPDYGHLVARNIKIIEINIKKNCASSYLISRIIPGCTVKKTWNIKVLCLTLIRCVRYNIMHENKIEELRFA